MNIHVLQCGSISVDPTVPYGKRLDLIEAAKQLTAADKNRITLPVFTYLIEHPKGLILVDTGWCREISPDGVYDPKAAAAVLPSQMVALFHPFVPKGMAIHGQSRSRVQSSPASCGEKKRRLPSEGQILRCS